MGSGVVGQFGNEIGSANGQFERSLLDAKACEPGFELVRGIAVETGAVFPVDDGVSVLQFGLRIADSGGSGGAEGNDGFSTEVVGVKEGEEYARDFSVPDGEAQGHNVVVGAGERGIDGRTGRSGTVLLLIGAGGRVAVIVVIACVGFCGGDLVSVGPEDIGHGIGNSLGGVGEGEVGYEDFLRA